MRTLSLFYVFIIGRSQCIYSTRKADWHNSLTFVNVFELETQVRKRRDCGKMVVREDSQHDLQSEEQGAVPLEAVGRRDTSA